MQEVVDKSTFNQRLMLYLIGSFAGLAIAMVVTGLYGVLSQLVNYRRREIGVRMALGATRAGVASMILRQGTFLIGVGLAIGLVLALLSGRLLKAFLFEVQPLDGWNVRCGGFRPRRHRPSLFPDPRAESFIHPAHAGAARRVELVASVVLSQRTPRVLP